MGKLTHDINLTKVVFLIVCYDLLIQKMIREVFHLCVVLTVSAVSYSQYEPRDYTYANTKENGEGRELEESV